MTLIVKVAGAGMGFGLQVFLARILGVTIYGDYVYALTWILLLVPIVTLGMNQAAILFIANYLVEKSWGSIRGFQQRSLLLVLMVSSSASVLFIAGVLTLPIKIRHELMLAFVVAGLLLPVLALIEAMGGILRGYNKVVIVEVVQLVLRPVTFALFIGSIYFALSLRSPSAAAVMGLQLLAASVVLIFLIIVWWRNVPGPVKRAMPSFHSRYWLTAGYPFMAISGISLLLSQTDTVMIGMFKGAESAGIYSVATRISALFGFGLAATGAVLTPMIARLYKEGKLIELQKIVTRASRAVFIFCVFFGCILYFWGEQVVRLFGVSFKAAYTPMAILAIGQIMNALAGPVGLIMAMTKHQTEVMYTMGISAILNIILNMMLIPRLGLEGAAISTAATTILWNIVLVWSIKIRLNMNPTVFHFGGGL